MKKSSLLVFISLGLAACGGGGDEIIFDTRLGPATRLQVETLPNTLSGDTANARYSSIPLEGPGMASKDGSGTEDTSGSGT